MKAKGKRTSASSPRPELRTKAVEPQKAKGKNREMEFRSRNSDFKIRNPQSAICSYLAVLGLLFALAVTGCGYQFSGGGEGIPGDVRKVFLQGLVNRSRDVGIEQEIASALRSEFYQRGRLQVVDRMDQADAVLSGVIRSVDHHAVSVNRHDEVLQYEMTLIADMTLRRRTPDEILWQIRKNKLVELYAGSRAAVVTTSSEFKTGTLNSEDVRRLSDIHLTETLSRQAREKLVTRFARELHQRLMETF